MLSRVFYFFFYCYRDHRYLPVLTPSFPTRRSSDLGTTSCATSGRDSCSPGRLPGRGVQGWHGGSCVHAAGSTSAHSWTCCVDAPRRARRRIGRWRSCPTWQWRTPSEGPGWDPCWWTGSCVTWGRRARTPPVFCPRRTRGGWEEDTSELQSLKSTSYAV